MTQQKLMLYDVQWHIYDETIFAKWPSKQHKRLRPDAKIAQRSRAK